jgi:hypothetical protein
VFSPLLISLDDWSRVLSRKIFVSMTSLFKQQYSYERVGKMQENAKALGAIGKQPAHEGC